MTTATLQRTPSRLTCLAVAGPLWTAVSLAQAATREGYVLGRHFARAGQRRTATLSYVAGTALLLGDGWAMTGGPAGTLTLAVGAITAMLWISAAAARAH